VQPAVVVLLDEVPNRPLELPRAVVHVELDTLASPHAGRPPLSRWTWTTRPDRVR
jgi:hypothetical protein